MVAAFQRKVDLWIQNSRDLNCTSLNIQVSFGRNVKTKMTSHGPFVDIRLQMSDTNDKQHAMHRLKIVASVIP